ncbi:uncharacterized protein LOC119373764 [Rhipicephalus sanguineus]|uniref:uncharacterized protein LOC119373764 n=1 Tax=Rhipicephalus sanguineus TaxID=34632 RepID=UPI0018933F3A|nr:uncharacterized protein LOC119373764 [Rhipicephalus sanguineus]
MSLILAALVVVGTLLGEGAAAEPSMLVTDQCDNDAEYNWTETLNAYLRRMPDVLTVAAAPATSWIMGFKTTAPKLQNLNNLWIQKPYYSYCVDNDTIIEVEVFANEPLHMNIDWTSRTGASGNLGTKVTASKMRMHFKVEPTSEDRTRIALQDIEADSLNETELYVTGTSEGLRRIIGTFGVLAKPYIELMWKTFLRVDVPIILLDHEVRETDKFSWSNIQRADDMNPFGGSHMIRIG